MTESTIGMPRSAIPEVPVRSIGELVSAIRYLVSETHVRWLFRGQANGAWGLSAAIHRDYTEQQERYFTNEFRVRASSRHRTCPSGRDLAGWLSLMQHYGVPTRLLDWSYSPLVASFFAVHPDYAPVTKAGTPSACVWALAAGRLNETQGYDPVIYPLDAWSFEELLEPAFRLRSESGKVAVAMALEHDSRIQVQQGAFTIHSDRRPLDELPGCEGWLRRFVIPGQSVQSFREELEIAGVRKSDLFPDLASLSSELRSRHRPGSDQ